MFALYLVYHPYLTDSLAKLTISLIIVAAHQSSVLSQMFESYSKLFFNQTGQAGIERESRNWARKQEYPIFLHKFLLP